MNSEVTTEISRIVSTLFKCDSSDVLDSTGPGDIPGWDSLGHIMLLEELKGHFGIKDLPIEELIEAQSISDLAEVLKRQL